MLGEAPAYSEAAIAQARKDGAAYLEELRRAGVVGTSRAVQVKGSKAGEGSLPVPKGAKILHLIRHGQGYHNLLGEIYQEMGREFSSTGTDLSTNNPYRRAEVLDPPLTELGRKQAKALRPQARRLSPELVVVSPLSRATQTALLAFSHLVNRSGSGTSATSAPFLCHEGAHASHEPSASNNMANSACALSVPCFNPRFFLS